MKNGETIVVNEEWLIIVGSDFERWIAFFGEDKVNLVKIDVYFILIIYSRIRLQCPNYESMK